MKNYEKTLPEGYKQTFHVDATDKKTGLIFNVIALIPLILVLAVVLLTAREGSKFDWLAIENVWILFLLVVLLFFYIVLHELVHGIAYKALTKQKLTFGLKWSCAFCGVPNIYVYRKTALIALLAPFVVFSVIFLTLTVFFGVIQSVLYIPFGVLFGMHLGGCSGDLYMTWLLVAKYKDPALLMKDTGPEQFLYLAEK